MTARIRDFLRNRKDDGPCLVVDLDVVRDNYQTFAKALPDTRVFYAVKANPAPEVLSLLASLGSCFDTASVAEIEMVLAAGATADRISYGNTIKKERDVARAYALGIRLFAVDCQAEVEKIARAAPGSRVFCRILSDCIGAEWPLSRKFGCEPAMAVDVLEHALKLGLEPHGVSFHVGSQQRNQHAWDRALASAAAVFRECGDRGMNLSMVNLGGGFPTKYLKNVPTVKTYGNAIFKALRKHFGNRIPETIIEPGRGMVGNAGDDRGRGRARLQEERGGRRALGLSRHRQVRRPRRDDGRVDPLPDPHPAGRGGDGAVRARRPDLRLGGRALRARSVHAAREPRDRRQGADRGDRRLHGDVLVGGLQRLLALEDGPHLTLLHLPRLRGRSTATRSGGGSCTRPLPNPPPQAGEGETSRYLELTARSVERGKELAVATIRKELVKDIGAREALLDLCFGEARFAKASERLREGRLPADGLSFAAVEGGRLVGSVRLWHVTAGPNRPALLLGPLAVHPDFRGRGIGAALMRRALADAARLGHRAVLLVGDAPYYGRFGFSAEKTGALWLPGPYEKHRLLAREIVPGALDGARGLISPTGTRALIPDLASLVAGLQRNATAAHAA